ncbi:YHS domain-containing protein [Sandaracinus amylolyticus]|uniref:TRASH domain-containing protein n=1 Tax=Sandaracinus amylolyticus TaxID=927083 RepID=A0A0F6VZK5_9BACT|nr:YHS domain-containing protein [Sandaracinus amylolyticus]AKF03662.1 hypothetical protein DB32_000811 [Sandaracinus amylolyticus]
MKRTILALLAVIALAACGGSSSSTETASAEPSHHDETTTAGAEQTALVPIGEAQIGDRSTCPVSGEEFVVTESSPTVTHEGRTYYFCCPHCAERFQANPAQFLQQQGATTESTEG